METLTLEQDQCPGVPACYCGKVHGLTVGSFHLCRVGGPTSEDEAQGRLFAAAGKLLAALRWIADHGDTGEGGRPAYHAMRAKARAAIRAFTGEE